jgi:hypothetical protein
MLSFATSWTGFGRSLAHLAQLIAEFQTHDVSLVCTSQGIDTTNQNPAAQLQLDILCAVAEFEREVIRDRVNAGLAAARKRGVKLGRAGTHRLLAEGKGVCAFARELRLPLSFAHKLVVSLRRQPASSLRRKPGIHRVRMALTRSSLVDCNADKVMD